MDAGLYMLITSEEETIVHATFRSLERNLGTVLVGMWSCKIKAQLLFAHSRAINQLAILGLRISFPQTCLSRQRAMEKGRNS